jgi:glycine cleavage system H protein
MFRICFNYKEQSVMSFIKMITQYVLRTMMTLLLATALFVTNLFWPAASQAIAQSLPVQTTNQVQSNQSWLTSILQLALANIPRDLRYTKDHEWVSVEGNVATVGITDFARNQLGDIVFVELPKVGDSFDQEAAIGTLESVKAVTEFYAPIAGKVVGVNEAISDDPEIISDDPYGEGWLVKIQFSDRSQLDALLSDQQYGGYIKEAEA